MFQLVRCGQTALAEGEGKSQKEHLGPRGECQETRPCNPYQTCEHGEDGALIGYQTGSHPSEKQPGKVKGSETEPKEKSVAETTHPLSEKEKSELPKPSNQQLKLDWQVEDHPPPS